MSLTHDRILEVCIDSIESALNAVGGGAGRLEVCSALSEGGLTPTIGLVSVIRANVPDISLYTMVRCRPGSDFIYTENEIQVMLEDIKALKCTGVQGFVFGALTSNGEIDIVTCERIVQCAFPFPVTFHRAFDVCANPIDALETVISLGFERILTSGQQTSAASDSACELIKTLIKVASNRIIIMPGAGVALNNIDKILDTGAMEIHGSFKAEFKLPIHSLNMGDGKSESIYITDRKSVDNVVKCMQKYNK